jgi:drug/metabolite transporter (DMT)-like permease
MGEFLALLTALLWALGVILFKRSVGFVAPFTLNVFKNCVALVLLAATTLALGQTRTLSVPPKDLILILVSGAIGIGISDTFYFMALSRLGASRTALVDCLYSPFVIVFSVIMLSEKLTPLAVGGGLLILGSVLVSSQRSFGQSLPRRQLLLGCLFGALDGRICSGSREAGAARLSPRMGRSSPDGGRYHICAAGPAASPE